MTTKEHWIGHPTAARRLTDDGVLYQTPENQSLAVVLGVFDSAEHLFRGANLWEIDGFVEGLEANADPAAMLMRERLNKIRELGKQSNWAECHPHADVISAEMRSRRELAEARDLARLSTKAQSLPNAKPDNPNANATAVRTMQLKGEPWSDSEQRTLLVESRLPDVTQEKLAAKYGVTRQRIGVLLAQARKKFEAPKKASPFPTAGTATRKNHKKNR